MRTLLILFLTLVQTFVVAQSFDRKTEIENIFNSLRKQNIIGKRIGNGPSWITSYQFEGDYSRERVFPNVSATSTICGSPITFESPIYITLRQIDPSYDSVFYQRQIQEHVNTLWSSQELDLMGEIRFIKRRLLRSEIGMISYPIFSKDGQTATVAYGTMNGNSVVKQRERIYFLRRNGDEWTTIATINSIKTW